MTITDFIRTELDRDQADSRRHGNGHIDATIRAHRTILGLYSEAAEQTRQRPAHGAATNWEARAGALYDAIQQLALIYSDRPGYQDDWRPHGPTPTRPPVD